MRRSPCLAAGEQPRLAGRFLSEGGDGTMVQRSVVAGGWTHRSGRAKIHVRKTWLSLWLLGAIVLLLLLNLG